MQPLPVLGALVVLLYTRLVRPHGVPLALTTYRSYYHENYFIPKYQQKNKFLPGPQNCPETGRTICEHVDNYPADEIYKVVTSTRTYKFNFSSVFGDDRDGDATPNLSQPPPNDWMLPHPNGYVIYQSSVHYDYHLPTTHLTPNRPLPAVPYHRGRGRRNKDEENLCSFTERVVIPKVGLNDKGEWKFIVNLPEKDPGLKQVLLAEICRPENGQCSSTIQLPLGYNGVCKQKFIKKKLLTLNGDGLSTTLENVFVPSCCACQISRRNN